MRLKSPILLKVILNEVTLLHVAGPEVVIAPLLTLMEKITGVALSGPLIAHPPLETLL